MSVEPGQRVVIETVRGLRGDWEPVEVAGVVERIDQKPWGRDALVCLDAPTQVGNAEWGAVGHLSLSCDSPNLRAVG